ncbi:hypothetical protein MKW92_024266 [Papaver armeniacum]|nr:hypothetical protein MKW92_024266 [Papaver armeniacum]
MDIGSSTNQQEDRIIEPGLTHVTIYRTNKEKKKKNIPNVFGLQTQANDHKKEPIIDHMVEDEGELPPYVIVVHGPPKVGKSLLIKCLLGHYKSVAKDVAVLADGGRRVQFVECPNNVNAMIDAAKYADAVICLIDARYGFEMETFEILNILQVHGTVEVMGVLTYLDGIVNDEILTETKQRLTEHFHSEIDEAAAVFCLPFLNEMYSKKEIDELASFISDMKFHRLSWRATQPYVLVNDFYCVAPQDKDQKDGKCERVIILKGYLRGCNNIKKGTKVHIAGVGDFPLFDVATLRDPFPLPDTRKTRKFQGKENIEIEGVRTGTYLRLEVRGVPYEMVENFCDPILVVGVGSEEEKAGYMQATLARHSWNSKLLKTRDPIIVSIGWRRYMTFPIYAMKSDIYPEQHQMLDYTPKDDQCTAMFWGPLAPPSTGVVVLRSMAVHEAAFRILATGFVHDNNQAEEQIGASCQESKEWKQVEVPRVFHQKMTAPKPRDRIWQHIGPADRLREPSEIELLFSKLVRRVKAPGPELTAAEIEAIINKRQERHNYLMRDYNGAGWRQTLEQQRAVLIVDGEPRARTSQTSIYEIDDPYQGVSRGRC